MSLSQMTPAQARVIDPILTTTARGYQNATLVGEALFPKVNVKVRGGKVIAFGKEAFLLYDTRRAPGTKVRRIQVGYEADPYTLTQHALEAQVPVELQQEAQQIPGIDLAGHHVNTVQDAIFLETEKEQADLATRAANYPADHVLTLSGTSQWSEYDPATSTANPSGVIQAAREKIRAKIGKYPNTLLMGPLVLTALSQQPKLLERTKYTSRDSLTPAILSALWDIPKIVVGQAIYVDDAGAFHDVWGRNVILAYVETRPLASRGSPSYGYTYQLENYPIVEQAYYDASVKSWIYPVTDERAPVLTGADAGFLIRDAVAP